MRVAVGVLGVSMSVFAVFVRRRRVLLGLLMLPVRMVVGSLEVVVGSRMMPPGRQEVVFNCRVLVLLGHAGSSGTKRHIGSGRIAR
jgi:hypothetical protein